MIHVLSDDPYRPMENRSWKCAKTKRKCHSQKRKIDMTISIIVYSKNQYCWYICPPLGGEHISECCTQRVRRVWIILLYGDESVMQSPVKTETKKIRTVSLVDARGVCSINCRLVCNYLNSLWAETTAYSTRGSYTRQYFFQPLRIPWMQSRDTKSVVNPDHVSLDLLQMCFPRESFSSCDARDHAHDLQDS